MSAEVNRDILQRNLFESVKKLNVGTELGIATSAVSKLKVEFNYCFNYCRQKVKKRISLSMFSRKLDQRVFECREFESDVNFNY